MVDHNMKSFQRRKENIKLLSQYLDTSDPTYREKKVSILHFVDLKYFYFSNSVRIPRLLLNLSIWFKASIKKEALIEDKNLWSYLAQEEVLKSVQIIPVFPTSSSGLTVHRTNMSYLVGIFYHFTLNMGSSSSVTIFLPSKLLNIFDSVSILCQLFWKVSSAPDNLWYEIATWGLKHYTDKM